MKIAVTYKNGEVFQHFGHSEEFKIYEIENDKVVNSEVISPAGKGHGALAGFLKDRGVDVLICGGIGGGAKKALGNAGIKLYGGVSGNADEAVKAVLDGSLDYEEDPECDHHDHDQGSHGENCGHHSCGEDNC